MQIDRTTAGGMPPRKVRKKTPPAAAVAAPASSVGDLPDIALQQVLSFLPAEEAVRTCVLARRWRHTWKSTAGLIILCGGERRREFADSLLRARGITPIETCEFRLLQVDEDDMHRVDLWIRHVLQCKVRVLRINEVCVEDNQSDDYGYPPEYYRPAGLPLISQHLKKLQLQNITILLDAFLDFSSCLVLEELEIRGCDLQRAVSLSSQSLKRLTIDGSSFLDGERMEICAPNVITLWLKVDEGSTPWLEGMPSLVGAVAKINNNDWGHAPICSILCEDCDSDVCDCYDRDDKSFLLHSLSEAQNLALIAHDTKCPPRTDLKVYPTFNKLKTLLLNEYWCEPPDFNALVSLLEHSPVLEKLTLQLYSEGFSSAE